MMNNKFKYLLWVVLLFSATYLLTGCHTPIVLDPKGALGVQEKKLILDAFLLMSIVVVPVIFMTLFFAWKYRESNTKARYNPNWYHSNALEFIIWGIPIIIILVLATLTWRTTHELDPYKPLKVGGKPMVIQAVALDWKWLFIYPEQHIATVNLVEFPVHRQVQFLITADAPMNGFQIPQLGTQIYAMAGMQTQVHLIANKPGSYYGRSTNFSGKGFAWMQFTAKATKDQASFDNWVKQVKKSGKNLNVANYNMLAKPSKNNPVTYYGNVTDGLFKQIIMKFMKPGSKISTGLVSDK